MDATWAGATRGLVVLLLFRAATTEGFELFQIGDRPSLISPTITANPVPVLVWVRDSVTLDDEQWIVGQVRDGLAQWESVPTSHIRFDVRVVRSGAMPERQPQDLLVIAANFADLTTGSGVPPFNGQPGTWLGAAADRRRFCGANCSPMLTIATHELGHALGLLHSSIDRSAFPAADLATMYGVAVATGLTQDDVAAISTAYPDTSFPLGAVTGSIRGATTAARAAAPATDTRRDCELAIAGASATFLRRGLRCLARCAHGAASVAACTTTTGDHCIAREHEAARAIMLRACSPQGARCPRCLDGTGDCDPDSGLATFAAAGLGRPLELEAARLSTIAAAIACDDSASADALTKQERLCSRRMLLTTSTAITAVRTCVRRCNRPIERSSVARCEPGYSDASPALERCVAEGLRRLRPTEGCDLPECAESVLATIDRRILEPAQRDARLTFCSTASSAALTGVNVVAVDAVTGKPVVARLSGAAGIAGGFDVVGLPPGSYYLHLLGGTSFWGSFPMTLPHLMQSDNFPTTVLGPFRVEAGRSIELGDIPVAIEPVLADRIAVGAKSNYEPFDITAGTLPAAMVGQPYSRWIHLRGGVRPLALLSTTGLPDGMSAAMYMNTGFASPYGEHWIALSGAPTLNGEFNVSFEVRDLLGRSTVLHFLMPSH